MGWVGKLSETSAASEGMAKAAASDTSPPRRVIWIGMSIVCAVEGKKSNQFDVRGKSFSGQSFRFACEAYSIASRNCAVAWSAKCASTLRGLSRVGESNRWTSLESFQLDRPPAMLAFNRRVLPTNCAKIRLHHRKSIAELDQGGVETERQPSIENIR